MDRYISRSSVKRFATICFLGSFTGCVANPMQVPTVWDKLGIPQYTALFRDSTINRNGNFPNLEKKPPLLKLADPANLAPEKPEMIKTAAKIKQDQDLKKQKIKAIKYLAEINCGCYNKDDAVAKAFLAALADCDPDVRKAAIEGLCVAAGNCSKCRNGCETTCCTEDILKKVQDIAFGVDANGCCKEPDAEIRKLAAGLLKKCPCPPPKPIEEIPAPPPSELEEIEAPSPSPEVEPQKGKGPEVEPLKGNRLDSKNDAAKRNSDSMTRKVSYRVNDVEHAYGSEPVVVAKRGSKTSQASGSTIANPDHLISARVVNVRPQLGEVLIELPEVYQLSNGWTMVLVDASGSQSITTISESSGRRLLLASEDLLSGKVQPNSEIKIGLVKR